MSATKKEIEVPMRITVLRPVSGVTLALQRGSAGLLPPSQHTADAASFDFTLRLGDSAAGKPLRWLGEFVQGSAADRFIYVNVGVRAGQSSTPWDRRAKVKLGSITRDQVDEVLGKSGRVLEASYEGRGRDGSPACATVPLLGGGWRAVE